MSNYDLDRFNYCKDPRTIAGMRTRAFTVEPEGRRWRLVLNDSLEEEIEEEGIKIPTHVEVKMEVCDLCAGRGTVVDPIYDCGGLTSDDFYDDPEFGEDYFSGRCDVRCPQCKGEKVLPHPKFPPEVQEAVDRWNQADADYAQLCASERANGCGDGAL